MYMYMYNIHSIYVYNKYEGRLKVCLTVETCKTRKNLLTLEMKYRNLIKKDR